MLPLGEKPLFQRGGEHQAALKALCSNFSALLSPIPKLTITPESWEESPETETCSLRSMVQSVEVCPQSGSLPRCLTQTSLWREDERRAAAWGCALRGIGEGLPFFVEMEGGC